jgi:hypothetical protein
MKTGLLILACVILSGCASFHTDMENEEGKMVSCDAHSRCVFSSKMAAERQNVCIERHKTQGYHVTGNHENTPEIQNK